MDEIDIQYIRQGPHVLALNVESDKTCHISVAFTKRTARRRLLKSIADFHKEEN